MGFLAALPAVVSAASSLFGSSSGDSVQDRATEAAIALQKQQYADAKTNLSPYMTTGTGANRRLSDVFLNGDMSQFYESPDYQFRLDQGRKAIESGAAARGGLYSGAMGKALADYGQDAASQEFGNFYNRLFGLSEQGRGAAGTLAGNGASMASNVGNLLTAQGANRASSYADRANTLSDLAGVIGGSDWYRKLAGTK